MPYMNIKINVKVLNLNEFNIEFREYLNFDNDLNTTGFIEDDSNTIIYLDFKNWKLINHKNDDKKEFNKVVIHELVHLIHANYCNKNYPNDKLWEGVAYYLADQKYSDYYAKFKKIIDTNSHEQVLKMLKNDFE